MFSQSRRPCGDESALKYQMWPSMYLAAFSLWSKKNLWRKFAKPTLCKTARNSSCSSYDAMLRLPWPGSSSHGPNQEVSCYDAMAVGATTVGCSTLADLGVWKTGRGAKLRNRIARTTVRVARARHLQKHFNQPNSSKPNIQSKFDPAYVIQEVLPTPGALHATSADGGRGCSGSACGCTP